MSVPQKQRRGPKESKQRLMWGSMSRKPGQPAEYLGQLYRNVYSDHRLAPSPGEKYPEIKFKSTSVEPSGGDHFKLTGDLTIKETTHPVVLDVVRYGEFNDPGMMGHRIAYGATAKINRKDFGLSFSMMLDGRLVVSEDIQITIEGELVEQKESADATASS